MTSLLRRYLPLLLAACILIPHALLFDFITDDAFISFRYARNLALHGELVFNLGERVEGYTNFLWTVLLALGIKLGIGPVLFSRFLGIAFAIGTLAVVNRISLRLTGEKPSPWHFFAPVALACMGAFACWSSGGLETQLFTFLITLAFHAYLQELSHGKGLTSSVYFALASLTRPEGVFLFALAACFRFLHSSKRHRQLWPRLSDLAWIGVFLLFFTPYYAWRFHYFGYPFPNTFYVKSAGGLGTWKLGVFYLGRFAVDYALPLLLLLCLLAPTSEPRVKDLRRITALVWLFFALYVVKVGGDFMGLYRFILPIVPLGALTLQETFRTHWQRLTDKTPTLARGSALVLLSLGYLIASLHTSQVALTFLGAEQGIDSPAYLKKYALERIPVGQWFAKQRQAGDLMTVGGAGVIPYYSEIPAYDVFGLVDKTIAHDPRMTVSNRPGHQKWGSDEYMLSRRPTFITHHYCLGTTCPIENGQAPVGYEWFRVALPGGQFYSFQKRQERSFFPAPTP